MNQRRSFLRDVALILAASILPKILQPIASEIEEELVCNKGILWYIENQPVTVVNYEVGDLSIKDFENIYATLRSSNYNSQPKQ